MRDCDAGQRAGVVSRADRADKIINANDDQAPLGPCEKNLTAEAALVHWRNGREKHAWLRLGFETTPHITCCYELSLR